MRFIATADWQLGMTAHFLDDDARPRFHQARLDAARRIANLAEETGAAFVVVCGDVFESNQLDRSVVARSIEVFRAFTVPLVLLPGNHDPLDAASIYTSPAYLSRVPEHVYVLRDNEPFEVVPGVEIVGAPWCSKRPVGDLVAGATAPLEPVPAETVRVIAGHGAVSTLNPDRDSLTTISTEALQRVLSDGRAHVAVLGDRHSTTEVAPGIWYPGAPEVTARREEDSGNVLLIDVDDAGVRVEKVRTGRWTFMTVKEELNSREDVEALGDRLRAIPDKERTAVWLAFVGTLSTGAYARLEQILDEAGDLFARIDHWQRHTDLAILPDDQDFAQLGLSGFAEGAVTELTGLAEDDGEQSEAAQDALSLLFRLSEAAG